MTLTVFAAIVIALAGIAGMLVLNELLKAATVATAKAQATTALARMEARGMEDLVVHVKGQLDHTSAELKIANNEVKLLRDAAPHYGRDKKTGRFTRIAG